MDIRQVLLFIALYCSLTEAHRVAPNTPESKPMPSLENGEGPKDNQVRVNMIEKENKPNRKNTTISHEEYLLLITEAEVFGKSSSSDMFEKLEHPANTSSDVEIWLSKYWEEIAGNNTIPDDEHSEKKDGKVDPAKMEEATTLDQSENMVDSEEQVAYAPRKHLAAVVPPPPSTTPLTETKERGVWDVLLSLWNFIWPF